MAEDGVTPLNAANLDKALSALSQINCKFKACILLISGPAVSMLVNIEGFDAPDFSAGVVTAPFTTPYNTRPSVNLTPGDQGSAPLSNHYVKLCNGLDPLEGVSFMIVDADTGDAVTSGVDLEVHIQTIGIGS